MIGPALEVLIQDPTPEGILEHTSALDPVLSKWLVDPGTQDTPVPRSIRGAKSHLWFPVDFVGDDRSNRLTKEDLARHSVQQKAPVNVEYVIDHLIVQKRHSGFE